MVAFADFPDQWQKLQEDRAKIPAAIEELLRYEAPSQYQVRTATQDVMLHGKVIPEGSSVLLVTGSATRDERMFPEPDRLDIDRERKMGFNLAFGYGVHSCLGRRSRGWRAASRWRRCSISSPSTKSIAAGCGGWRCPTCVGGRMCRCAKRTELCSALMNSTLCAIVRESRENDV